jgi:hypothetical protein
VELLARLLDGGTDAPPLPPGAIREVPLLVWQDVRGSKLRAGGMLWAGLQVLALLVRRRIARRAATPALPPATRRPDEVDEPTGDAISGRS